MEKLENETYSVERTIHHFYCDNCDKYLGKEREYEDGYFRNLGEFEQKFYIDESWYAINKCLCSDCKKKFLKKMKIALKELGFEKECY